MRKIMMILTASILASAGTSAGAAPKDAKLAAPADFASARHCNMGGTGYCLEVPKSEVTETADRAEFDTFCENERGTAGYGGCPTDNHKATCRRMMVKDKFHVIYRFYDSFEYAPKEIQPACEVMGGTYSAAY